MRGILRLIALAGGIFLWEGARAGITFNLVPPAGGIDPQALAGFTRASQRWAGIFDDNVTINVSIKIEDLGVGILGSTSTPYVIKSYTDVRTALAADAKGSADVSAVGSLTGEDFLKFITTKPTTGERVSKTTSTPNSTTLKVTRGNARALGLFTANSTATDGGITFSPRYLYDYNPDDGIDAGTYDFVGLATHEIGHLMGFISGVDRVDEYTLPNGSTPLGGFDSFAVFSPLDLFRYSAESAGLGMLDLAVGGMPYTSIDGGVTPLALMSTGQYNGDGRQASHWKIGLGLGIMNPVFFRGVGTSISANDVTALDVIGWDRVAQVPEPQSVGLICVVLGPIVRRRKCR